MFLRIPGGPRLSAMGYRPDDYTGPLQHANHEYGYKFTYIKVDCGKVVSVGADSKDLEGKATRNMYVRLDAAGTLEVKGEYMVLVEPNPELAEYGVYQPSYHIMSGTPLTRPSIHVKLHRDLDIKHLDHLLKLYLVAWS